MTSSFVFFNCQIITVFWIAVENNNLLQSVKNNYLNTELLQYFNTIIIMETIRLHIKRQWGELLMHMHISENHLRNHWWYGINVFICIRNSVIHFFLDRMRVLHSHQSLLHLANSSFTPLDFSNLWRNKLQSINTRI